MSEISLVMYFCLVISLVCKKTNFIVFKSNKIKMIEEKVKLRFVGIVSYINYIKQLSSSFGSLN